MEMHLAQFNIGRMTHDLEDPRMADFMAGIDTLNSIADRSPGFVWKYETGTAGVVQEDVDNDPLILVNLTVWESVETLQHFVWKTLHKHFVNRKADWFQAIDRAHFVMWWIAKGHRPTLDEARAKLETLRQNGSSKAAFGWDWLTDKQAVGM